MPRSPEQKQANARKYGRRQAVRAAADNARELTALARRLLVELKASGGNEAQVRALAAELQQRTDVTRRRAAVWAIVDALEAVEARHRR